MLPFAVTVSALRLLPQLRCLKPHPKQGFPLIGKIWCRVDEREEDFRRPPLLVVGALLTTRSGLEVEVDHYSPTFIVGMFSVV